MSGRLYVQRNLNAEAPKEKKVPPEKAEHVWWKDFFFVLAVFVFMVGFEFYWNASADALHWEQNYHVAEKKRDDMKAKMKKEISELKQEQKEFSQKYEKERDDVKAKMQKVISELKQEQEVVKVCRVTEKERDGMKAKMKKVVIELKQEQEVVGCWRVAFFLLILSIGCLVAIAMNIYCWKKNCRIAEQANINAEEEMDITESKENICRIRQKECDDIKVVIKKVVNYILQLKPKCNEFFKRYQNSLSIWGRNANNCQKRAFIENENNKPNVNKGNNKRKNKKKQKCE